jgi:hypothetical protein
MTHHDKPATHTGELDYAASDFNQLRNVVKALQLARKTLDDTLRLFSPEDILAIARRGAIEELQGAEHVDRLLYKELVLGSSALARTLVDGLGITDGYSGAVRRARYTLNDLWNRDADTTAESDADHITYIRGSELSKK